MYETKLIFDYSKEASRDILCIDCKSFYASVECVKRGLHPLETKLVVMSYPSDDPKERGSGLILASSPAAKKAYGISNISRARDLPFPYPADLVIAAPQMKLYMLKNTEINNIYKSYADESNHHVYSVDESFVDVTGSLKLFGHKTAYEIAKLIQADVLKETGIYTTIGIGDNPLMAKLALDNAAKHQPDMIAEWRYQDVLETIWKIPEMTDFWGIGKKTKQRLNRLGIFSIHDLAHADYYYLKSKLGVMGAQLYAHSWGIDRSFLGEKVKVSSKSIGNSQVLNKDYVLRSEIEIVLMEMADQVATRLRRAGAKAQVISLSIGYSIGFIDRYGRTGFHQQMKIPPTHSSSEVTAYVLLLFNNQFDGQTIRNIGVGAGNLVYTDSLQLDLFQDPDEQVKDQKKDHMVDVIRKKYGFTSIVRAASLLEGGRAIARSSLVGGHAGGMAGLEEGEDNAKRSKKQDG
ncbi:dna polymerase type-y hhh motif [Trichococcus palustris]|uniref:Dna polymerase type-y hhh motif n=1 Tax=Trichococcus palustris TaxID=140314 RepID=A0A143YX54_9LACT|nr:Y-family DNA polymerase [Trichococcus palustris]CZR00808.1 dna polymerase type-y hhh motif [Trichococcus palustris]SFK90269.1 DNA polymerase V [Trichococcus palustris]